MTGAHPNGADDFVHSERFRPNEAGQSSQDDQAEPQASIRATPFVWRDPSSIPPRRWLYGRHYIRSYATATIGAAGGGKSSLSLVEAVAMASGRNLLDVPVKAVLSVWYVNLEDPREEIERRIAGILLHYKVRPAEIEGRLFIDSGRDVSVIVAEKFGDRVVVAQPVVDDLVEEIRARDIDCLIIDPFVSSHGVPENDNGAIDRVAKVFARVADLTSSSVELVHHTRKPSRGQSSENTVDDARGAVALIGAVRSARVLNTMTVEEAAGAGVKTEDRRRYFRVDDGKANMQPPADRAVWRKLVSVGLGNHTGLDPEDWIGVATAWVLPGAFDMVTTAHLDRVVALVREGEYRVDVQAKAWIGRAVADVLGLDADEAVNRTKIKGILHAWFQNGALSKEWRKDRFRELREFVIVGSGETSGDAAP